MSTTDANLTITTACDRNFLWGAFLLIGSVRHAGIESPIHVLSRDFLPGDTALLTQFSGVKTFSSDRGVRRSVTTDKPEVLLSAQTDYVAWIDADCFVTGNVREFLPPENDQMQIRLRASAENADVYHGKYAPGESTGGIPAAILERWKQDVADLDSPRLQTTCVANVFILHRRYLPFIELWQRQIEKVLPKADLGVKSEHYPEAYIMTDESVLSSLLTFSSIAPTPAPYKLNLGPVRPYLAHFGMRPKPWEDWAARNWRYYDMVLELLASLRKSGYELPPLPRSFDRGWKTFYRSRALFDGAKSQLKGTIRKVMRAVRKRS